MKKFISIGVALALVAMAVLPIGVAAQPPGCPDIGYTYPTTYSKIPFAIVQSGLELIGNLMNTLASTLGLPDWLDDVLLEIAPWAGGPLSWTVDMMAWGISLVGGILDSLASTLGLPDWLAPALNDVACGLFTPFTCNVSGTTFEPCAP